MEQRKTQSIKKMPEAIGQQVLLDLRGCPSEILNDKAFLEKTLKEAAEKMGATVVLSNFHPFAPIGVSGVVIIMESHLTIHTWPEHGYAAIDIFTCGVMDMEPGVEYLKERLEAKVIQKRLVLRG